MADPHAILLVPTEAGAALLADGLLGSLPPMVSRWPDGTSIAGMRLDNWAAEPARHAHGRRSRVTLGLPLWWNGALVPEGWDRARRVCGELPRDQRLGLGPLGGWFCPMSDDVLVLARFLASAGLCCVVLLDLVDGALAERAP